MNPPSALHSAMGRDKKPFSYLPGGLDLSQIKSEKMAKRLMRNAMNPGVSETPIQNVQSPTTPTTPVLVPNFNCLPVQVFPSFTLPANPKSLLRTRSHPHQPRDFRTESKNYEKNNSPTVFTPQPKAEINNNSQSVSNNNNKPVYNTPIANKSIHRPVSMYSAIPEYEETHLLNPISINEQSIQRGRERSLPPELKPSLMPSALCANLKNRSRSSSATREIKTSRSPEFIDSSNDVNKQEENNWTYSPKPTQVSKSQNEQTSIKTTEKSSQEKKTTTTTKTEHTNGNADAELTVTLPSTKSIPKVDTKVDVTKNVLPDGRVQEITTTTITTTLDGKTEIRTKTETKTFPKEEYEEVEEEEEEEEEEEGVQIEEVKPSGQETNVSQTEYDNDSSSLIENQETSETITTKETVTHANKETKQEVEQLKEEKEEQVEEEELEDEIEEEIVEEVEEEVVQETDKKEDNENLKEKCELQEQLQTVDVQKVSDNNESLAVQVEDGEEQEEEIEETEENEEIIEENVENNFLERPEKSQSSDTEQILSIKQENFISETNKKTEITEIKEEVKEQVVQEEVEKEEEEEEKYEEAEEEVHEAHQPQEAFTKVNDVKQTDEQKSTKTDSFDIQTTVKESFKEENRAKTITETLFSPAQNYENSNDGLRDVPIKLEKVEDIEIKPIGLPTLKKTTTETTEIITSKTPTSGPLSTQTELQRVENVVVQKRITTTLDRNYDELTQQGIPTSKSYFAPSREQIDLSPQPTKTLVPMYEPPSQKEQRHSLLLDRLSVERQLPIFDNYQIFNTNESSESQNVLTEEPRAEVVTVSNVKPSSISNQLWFQQSEKKNEIYNNVTASETTQEWSNQRAPSQPSLQQQEKPKPSQPEYQPPKPAQSQYQPQYQPQSQYQPQYQPQPEYQPQYQPQPEYQTQKQTQQEYQSEPQYQFQSEYQSPQLSQPHYQPQYEYPAKTPYQNPPQPQTQYNSLPKTPYQYQPKPEYQNQSQYQSKETYTESQNYQQPSFVKAPYTDNYSSAYPSTNSHQQSYTNINNNTSNSSTTTPWTENSYGNSVQNSNTQTNQYSYKDNNTSYKQEAQNYASSYVPPPWEQDSSYVYENTNSTWQSAAPSLSNNELPSWQPKQPKAKVTKPTPTAYIPPAPNQSFVKPVSKSDILSKQAGRKTYYSEYERRYISVPETTYVPSENKEIHTQVDSTAQYYYDNDEPIEKEEPLWRKELREFSEKKFAPSYETEQINMSNQQPITQSVKPPWEPEVVYEKVPTSAQYTSTPTWSQTLKPRSSRETSFETDYVSQEWPRNNSISRGRPLSSYNTTTTQRSERSRGVSVDRYNPNSYHSPIPTEHPPVQSHTLTPLTAPQHKIHNRHSRASAEPRELSAQNQRMWGDTRLRERETPIQSRSFKYLQWITGTDE